MTTRTELSRQYRAERLYLGSAADYVSPGIDFGVRPGYPSRARWLKWNRDWLEMLARERAAAGARVSG